MKLRISDDLALPGDFITQTAAILAIRGAGKSNLAAVLAEQMFAAKLPFVVIDPTGTWVGLRSAGTAEGLGVVIFGGREYDVPLERGSGPAIADLVAAERLSSVVDVSEFSEGDKVRFLTEFAKRLYRVNRDPLHLFLEEADDYVPQKPYRDQAECLRAFQNIVRRGRARGLGITMITQRSAVVSKDVLTQIETLFVLRTTSPQDRKAIGAWVDYHGQSRELVESLPSLRPGEAWVWSPHYLGMVKRIQVNRRTTLDTAATPNDASARRAPATKADVDLEAVTKAMHETIERAKADDPKELRARVASRDRRILELERQLAAKPATKTEVKTVDVPILKDAQLSRLEATVSRLEKVAERATLEAEQRQQIAQNARTAAQEIKTAIAAAKAPVPLRRADSAPTAVAIPPRPRLAPRPAPPPGGSEGGSFPVGERATLTAAAQYGDGCDRAQLSILTGYRRSTRDAYVRRLREKGYVELRGDRVIATQAGVDALGAEFEPLPTGAALLEYWRRKLPEGERKVLDICVEAFPESADREAISEATNYARSSRDAYIQRLGARKLVTTSREGVRASEMLFDQETA